MYEVDFLPERIRQQRVRRRRLIRQGYLLAGCVVAMGLLTYIRQGRIGEARAELAALSSRSESLQRQISMIPALERQMADLLIKKRIDEELGSRTDCTAVLAELCRVMPPNLSLVSMELRTVELDVDAAEPVRRPAFRTAIPAVKKPPPAAARVLRRVSLVITGLAPTNVDVANFIGQLSASHLFEDVRMGYAKTVVFRGRSVREFQASCYLAK